MLRTLFHKIKLNLWVRLLKYEAYRKTLIQFYQVWYLKESSGSYGSYEGTSQRIPSKADTQRAKQD
jgi:hypothetical protein